MQNNNLNQTVPYSKINTILLVLLLVMALGVFYVTYKQNHEDDVSTDMSGEMSDYNASEFPAGEMPGAEF
ncbi:hypothetical protein K2Q02_00900 [Patescibacteria group bacterium]|nr:hypothetical protein [Patescibacteria group bacterium]